MKRPKITGGIYGLIVMTLRCELHDPHLRALQGQRARRINIACPML
jgi:hypothetical protein